MAMPPSGKNFMYQNKAKKIQSGPYQQPCLTPTFIVGGVRLPASPAGSFAIKFLVAFAEGPPASHRLVSRRAGILTK